MGDATSVPCVAFMGTASRDTLNSAHAMLVYWSMLLIQFSTSILYAGLLVYGSAAIDNSINSRQLSKRDEL